VSCAKTAEPFEMPFWKWTQVSPWNHELGVGGNWQNLANMIESPVCGGDAASCQITLTTHLHFGCQWLIGSSGKSIFKLLFCLVCNFYGRPM